MQWRINTKSKNTIWLVSALLVFKGVILITNLEFCGVYCNGFCFTYHSFLCPNTIFYVKVWYFTNGNMERMFIIIFPRFACRLQNVYWKLEQENFTNNIVTGSPHFWINSIIDTLPNNMLNVHGNIPWLTASNQVIVVTQERAHCLICTHDVQECTVSEAECRLIRQCTSVCVATNILHFQHS